MEIDYPKTRMDNFFAKAAGSELADDSMEPITDREYWINEMAKKTAGGGLPTIEEGDDGKVLTVSSGEAVWASGGGGGLFVANWNTNTGALDKTAGELIEAHESGKHLVVSPSLEEEMEGFSHIDVFEVHHLTYMSGDEEIDYYGFAIYDSNIKDVLRFEASSADDYPTN